MPIYFGKGCKKTGFLLYSIYIILDVIMRNAEKNRFYKMKPEWSVEKGIIWEF